MKKEIRQMVYKKYDKHCAYCGIFLEMKQMQVDHIHPKHLNGKDILENYNPACRMCNFYKGSLTIEKFREQIKTLHKRLEKLFIYRLARSFNLVQESFTVNFYFEKNFTGGKMKKNKKERKICSTHCSIWNREDRDCEIYGYQHPPLSKCVIYAEQEKIKKLAISTEKI